MLFWDPLMIFFWVRQHLPSACPPKKNNPRSDGAPIPVQKRVRTIIKRPSSCPDSVKCPKDMSEDRKCNPAPPRCDNDCTPTDCKWEWSAWGKCSKTCGNGGTRYRQTKVAAVGHNHVGHNYRQTKVAAVGHNHVGHNYRQPQGGRRGGVWRRGMSAFCEHAHGSLYGHMCQQWPQNLPFNSHLCQTAMHASKCSPAHELLHRRTAYAYQ